MTKVDRLILLGSFGWIIATHTYSQGTMIAQMGVASYPIRKLPDTGQVTDYTATYGEDADYNINVPSYTKNGDGTVTDNVTGLMWQQNDSGELTFEASSIYADTLSLGKYADWRLPTSHELFGILNHDRLNPALDTTYFTKTLAEYWWSSDKPAGDTTRIWVANAGGGIGPHPKSETISAGGTKRFHARAVRVATAATALTSRFKDNGDSTVTDQSTGLVWQKFPAGSTMVWEDALKYGEALAQGGFTDWRIPNIKELQSLNDETLLNPSVDRTFFPGFAVGKFWSSTTQFNATTRAWYMDFQYGIATYELKTTAFYIICVRGGTTTSKDSAGEVLIPGGEFEMGDHHGFVDPSHPSDELPIHKVRVDSFFMSATETSNKQTIGLLNYAVAKSLIEVKGNCVFLAGGLDTLLFLNSYASYSSIGWDGKTFSIVDFRANHPVIGIMWKGAAALCNWMSLQSGLQECYNLTTWTCDFTRNGYRLPTEAEWEYAGRGGQYNPYRIYPTGDSIDIRKVNLPASGDPYETGAYPNTTPVGFYDDKLKLKSEYTWPGSATSYQTLNGANPFGLYDMQGNVWEFVNDWYGQNYYSASSYDNPKGPDTGFIMPDGKPYRGMRGGNWYNGLVTNGINDGHSRVANRNPSYYRGPLDPNHPWYHIGFRWVRTSASTTGVIQQSSKQPERFMLMQNFPNPFNPNTVVSYQLPVASTVKIVVYDVLGREVATLVNEEEPAGVHSVPFDASRLSSGIYLYRLSSGSNAITKKMILMK
jgi:formylglycine-generating enzyme required for sulfatase activity